MKKRGVVQKVRMSAVYASGFQVPRFGLGDVGQAGGGLPCIPLLLEWAVPAVIDVVTLGEVTLGPARTWCFRERVHHWQPTGPSPLYHQDDLMDWPRAMGV